MKRKPFERAIIYAGVLGGLSLDELNALLLDGSPGAAKVPESSYRSMRSTYFPHWTAAIGDKASVSQNAFGEHIFHPQPWGELSIDTAPGTDVGGENAPGDRDNNPADPGKT
jgi:hypothetical protein